jgi:hypothetical protein
MTWQQRSSTTLHFYVEGQPKKKNIALITSNLNYFKWKHSADITPWLKALAKILLHQSLKSIRVIHTAGSKRLPQLP